MSAGRFRILTWFHRLSLIIGGRQGLRVWSTALSKKNYLVLRVVPNRRSSSASPMRRCFRRWTRIRLWLAENQGFLRMVDRLDANLKLWLSRDCLCEDLLFLSSALMTQRLCLDTFAGHSIRLRSATSKKFSPKINIVGYSTTSC